MRSENGKTKKCTPNANTTLIIKSLVVVKEYTKIPMDGNTNNTAKSVLTHTVFTRTS